MPPEGEIVGIGIDLVSWKRMEEFLARTPAQSLDRVLTPAEQQAFQKSLEPVPFFARLFAAKEACFKAGDGVWLGEEDFRQIEIALEGEDKFRAAGPSGLGNEGRFFKTPDGIGALVVARRNK